MRTAVFQYFQTVLSRVAKESFSIETERAYLWGTLCIFFMTIHAFCLKVMNKLGDKVTTEQVKEMIKEGK